MDDAWPFVVLRHEGVEKEHFDLMVQVPGEAGLRTWRIQGAPDGWAQGVLAERIGDHRPMYMTYEGEISGGRGRVRRVEAGEARVIGKREGKWRIELKGPSLACVVELPLEKVA